MAEFDPLSLISGGIQGGFQYAGGKAQADAMDQASQRQTQTAMAALKFSQQQAENDYRNQEVNRFANWQNYQAHQQANNTIRAALGLKPVDIPAYVKSVDPNFAGAAPIVGGGRPAPAPSTINGAVSY